MHRAEFQRALAKYAVPNTNMQFNKRLRSYSYTSGKDPEVILYFFDGSEARADIVIGADGIHSPTRTTLLTHMSEVSGNAECEDHIDPIWSGTLVYRYLIPASALETAHPGHRALHGPVVVRILSILSLDLADRTIASVFRPIKASHRLSNLYCLGKDGEHGRFCL